jgi:hypothetical protein
MKVIFKRDYDIWVPDHNKKFAFLEGRKIILANVESDGDATFAIKYSQFGKPVTLTKVPTSVVTVFSKG